MGLFDVFTSQPIELIEAKSSVAGMVEVASYTTTGVFSLAGGMTSSDNIESRTSGATVKIRPTEDFVANTNHQMVGHFVRVARGDNPKQLYRVESQVEAYDFDCDCINYYRLALKKEQETALCQPSSPLV